MTATFETMTAAQRGINCPRCAAPMRPLHLSTHRQTSMAVDHCTACRLVWFDELESVQLDGLGWVRLLREMEEGRTQPLADAAVARPACPACALTLNTVQNRTRYGLFAALECPQRHGHLHSHSGLLAERGLVRPMGAAERRALAQEKHRLHCFNCGAPAASSDDHCSYCRTALVVLDLPRLAHSLRLRNDALAPAPTTPGRHTVWPCRGCGAPLDPGRETSCSHCSHLVVAQELPDILPLLEAAEAEQAAAAALDAQRRAGFASTRRQGAAAARTSPPRALTRREPAPVSRTRTFMLGGWLPLLLLLAAALLLALLAAADVPLAPRLAAEVLRTQRVGADPRALWAWAEAHRVVHPGDAEGQRHLRRGLLDIYTRQIAGDTWPAKATVGGVIEGAPELLPFIDRREQDRLARGLTRHLRLLPVAADNPPPLPPVRPFGQWPEPAYGRLVAEAPGVWHDMGRNHGLWLPTVENTSAATLVVEWLSARMVLFGPDSVHWRCQPATAGASPLLKPGQRTALLCRSTNTVSEIQNLWSEAMYHLNSGTALKLEWGAEGLDRPGAWRRAVDLLVADGAQVSLPLDRFLRRHTDARRDQPALQTAGQAVVRHSEALDALRALTTREGWAEMSGARRVALALAALMAAFVAFCALMRWLGERLARWAALAFVVPLCYLAGRGEGAASVLLVGMYLSLAVICGLVFSFASRLYRDAFFRRLD